MGTKQNPKTPPHLTLTRNVLSPRNKAPEQLFDLASQQPQQLVAGYWSISAILTTKKRRCVRGVPPPDSLVLHLSPEKFSPTA